MPPAPRIPGLDADLNLIIPDLVHHETWRRDVVRMMNGGGEGSEGIGIARITRAEELPGGRYRVTFDGMVAYARAIVEHAEPQSKPGTWTIEFDRELRVWDLKRV